MEFVFFGAFSLVAAFIFNWISPKIAASAFGQKAAGVQFIGATLVTGIAFFLTLLAAGFLLGLAGKRAAAMPPTA